LVALVALQQVIKKDNDRYRWTGSMLALSFTKTTDALNATPEQHAVARPKCYERGLAST